MTNSEGLALVKETPGLMEMMRRRKHYWIEHIV